MLRYPVNFRAFLVVALSVIAAIFFAYAYMFNAALGISLGCIYLAFLVALTSITILKYKFRGLKLRYVIAAVLSVVLSACAFGAAVSAYNNRRIEYNGYYNVSGRVCAVDVRTGDYRFNLEDLSVNGKDVDGIMRITVTASDRNIAELIEYGDSLSFCAEINAVKLYDNGTVNGYSYRTDVRYTATVKGDDISIYFGAPTWNERFLQSWRTLFTENMGDKYGNIAFSMVTGDKYALDNNVTDYFNAAGLGHIMAVSGLHIGFLIMVLNFIMKKLNRKIRYSIIAVMLAAYAVLADFSPSVMRAVIMAYISGAGMLIGGRRDMLSSLCCAFSFILAIKPLYLFDVGFLLSFGALFGIALFTNQIKRFLVRRGAHRKVGDAVGASVSVTLGIAPAQISYFGSVNLIECLVNVILLPYISVAFISVLCLSPIAAIPHCGAVLTVCKYILMPLDYIAYGVSAIPYSTLYIRAAAAVFCCYPIMFCASGYFMVKKGKPAVIIYSAAMCLFLCLICAL